MNILLIEDNEGDIELTKIAFKRKMLSSSLSVAHDGAEALDSLARQGPFGDTPLPDLIMLDLNMPRMGGREFLQTIKQNERLKSIPVIILTSSDAPADIRACYEQHANCYILKPFELEKFMDMTKQVEDFWSHIVRLPEKERPLFSCGI